MNSHYSAVWLNSTYEFKKYQPTITLINGAKLSDYKNGGITSATGTWTDAGAQYILQNSKAKTNGTAPDGDVFIEKITF